MALKLSGVGLVLIAISWTALRITIKAYKGSQQTNGFDLNQNGNRIIPTLAGQQQATYQAVNLLANSLARFNSVIQNQNSNQSASPISQPHHHHHHQQQRTNERQQQQHNLYLQLALATAASNSATLASGTGSSSSPLNYSSQARSNGSTEQPQNPIPGSSRLISTFRGRFDRLVDRLVTRNGTNRVRHLSRQDINDPNSLGSSSPTAHLSNHINSLMQPSMVQSQFALFHHPQQASQYLHSLHAGNAALMLNNVSRLIPPGLLSGNGDCRPPPPSYHASIVQDHIRWRLQQLKLQQQQQATGTILTSPSNPNVMPRASATPAINSATTANRSTTSVDLVESQTQTTTQTLLHTQTQAQTRTQSQLQSQSQQPQIQTLTAGLMTNNEIYEPTQGLAADQASEDSPPSANSETNRALTQRSENSNPIEVVNYLGYL